MRRKINPEPALFSAPVREWRILREFPDYEISNDGRLRRYTAGSNTKSGAHIRATVSSSGYPKYGLTRGGKRVFQNAHRLVAMEFLAPAPLIGALVLHDDDNPLNCVWTNLKWGDQTENILDAKRNGKWQSGANHSSARKPWTRPRGSSHGCAKLDEDKVRLILQDARSASAIAKTYGVNSALIYRIKKGEIWRHITDPGYVAITEPGGMNA
jgi:hypothetical protein